MSTLALSPSPVAPNPPSMTPNVKREPLGASEGEAGASAWLQPQKPLPPIKLQNGTTLSDAIIIPNALQTLESSFFQPAAVFEQLSATEKHPVDQDIAISADGLAPILITGAHPALHYRGNKLKRHKIWAQTNYTDGLLKYGYTGWQHAIAGATRDIAAYPVLDVMLLWLNSNFADILSTYGLPECNGRFNHAIFTRYEDEKDFIGMHSDKEKDFVDGSYFVVFKLGASRDFAFSANDEIIWQETLTEGTAIIVKTGSANQQVKHGVPVMNEMCGPSGSIVFRCIKTVIPWADVQKNIETAKMQKKKRKAIKKIKAKNKKKGSGKLRRRIKY